MMEINLDRAAYYQEKMKSAADRMSYGVQELQNVINTIERQVGLEEFVPSLSSALEELQEETRTLRQMETGLGEIIRSWKETDIRIVREYQQENVSQVRVNWSSVYFSNLKLKEMGIRFLF